MAATLASMREQAASKPALQWLDVLEQIDGMLPPGYLRKRADWQDRARG